MRLEHESEKLLKEKILQIVGKYLDLSKYRVFFFGSRVTGKAREASDIDVGIEGKEPVSLRVLNGIREEIEELPVLYKIDVVDFAETNEKFKRVAKEHLELVN